MRTSISMIFHMLTGYCAGWSLKQLITEGLGGITGKISSSSCSIFPCSATRWLTSWESCRTNGRVRAFLPLIPTLPFVKADNLTYPEVKKCIESFIYGVNTPSRWGTQAPFSNITLDWTVPDDLAELPAIVGGKEMDFKYKDCKPEMDMVNKAFIRNHDRRRRQRQGFRYPDSHLLHHQGIFD